MESAANFTCCLSKCQHGGGWQTPELGQIGQQLLKRVLPSLAPDAALSCQHATNLYGVQVWLCADRATYMAVCLGWVTYEQPCTTSAHHGSKHLCNKKRQAALHLARRCRHPPDVAACSRASSAARTSCSSTHHAPSCGCAHAKACSVLLSGLFRRIGGQRFSSRPAGCLCHSASCS